MKKNVYERLDLSRSRDRLGRWTYFFYDALRRLVLTRDAMGRTVSQEWCNCGALAKLTDANGNATSWQRDLQSRVTSETRTDSSQTLFTYENSTSRLKRRTDPRGQYRDTTYFKDDNVQQISYPNASPATASVSFTYDSVYNRVATMVDGTGTTNYTYYPVTTVGTLGATQLSTVDGPLSNDTISYSHDELGRSLSRSINSVAATQIYDVLGRISSATNALGTFNYSYVNQTPRLSSLSYPNGQTTSYSYYANSGDRRLQEILNQKTGAVTISKFNYTYDGVGNIKTWTQQTDSNPAKAYDLVYDTGDQLTSATWRTTDPTPSTLKRYNYVYDPAGNRTTEQIDDAPLKATYNNMNRLQSQDPGGTLHFAGTLNEAAIVTIQSKPARVNADNSFGGTVIVSSGTSSIEVKATDYSGNTRTNTYDINASGSTKAFTHDSNGNVTSDGTRTFEWDAENRLLAVNNGTHRSEFSYDGLSRRVRIVEKDNSVTTSDTRFLWCNLELCEERDSTGGTVTKRFFPQGEQQGADNFTYAQDHLDSTRELIDSTATVRARYEYDIYGRQIGASGDRGATFGFTRQYTHLISGLVLFAFRAYDPATARWISEDPLGLEAGTNFYSYVANRPTIDIDPLGLEVRNPANYAVSKPVMDALQAFNQFIGAYNDIIITGGNRPSTSRTGAGSTSLHVQRLAADISVPGQDHITTANQALKSGLFGGVGWYEEGYRNRARNEGPHVHVDLRKAPAQWGYRKNGEYLRKIPFTEPKLGPNDRICLSRR
ncbi:MAG TPA: RHS repeat-associated core domain-containing protein [Terriglobia bacterium]|nr:RHS repeat-associated core domain-containing protein [Terriglobia bacterium]